MNNFFQPLLDAIYEFLHGAAKDILTFFDSLAHTIALNGGSLLLEAAADAVAAAEAKGGTGREKFEAAQAAVIATLTAKGITVVLNAVNGSIEAAVAQRRVAEAT